MSLDLDAPALARPREPEVREATRAGLDEPARAVGQPAVEGGQAALEQAYRGGFAGAFGPHWPGVYGQTVETARLFGGEAAAAGLERGRFGPVQNEALAGNVAHLLRAGPGREAVLGGALAEGAPGERAASGAPGLEHPNGPSIVVLWDRDAAGSNPNSSAGPSNLNSGLAFGHTAVLVGSDGPGGWRLYSKDGEQDGRTQWTNNGGAGQTSGAYYATFNSLDHFFQTSNFADRFEGAVRVEFDDMRGAGSPADIERRIQQAAEGIIREPYSFSSSSCAHVAEAALEAAGVRGFTITSRVLRPDRVTGGGWSEERRELISPNLQYAEARLRHGRDDGRLSEFEDEWAGRTGGSEPPPGAGH